jgi:hypothetical protein
LGWLHHFRQPGEHRKCSGKGIERSPGLSG